MFSWAVFLMGTRSTWIQYIVRRSTLPSYNQLTQNGMVLHFGYVPPNPGMDIFLATKSPCWSVTDREELLEIYPNITHSMTSKRDIQSGAAK